MLFRDTHANACILIIDDEPLNIKLLAKILQASGYRIIHGISDSREALSVYQEVNPDLVLLDLRMPHKDGYQVLEELMAVSQDVFVPVLILSAVQEQSARVKALEMGAHDFIIKPFDHEEVLNRISNVLNLKFLYTDLETEKATLEKKVLERTRDLHESQLEIISRLSFAAEFRDEGTANHIIRVGEMVRVLATCMGLNPETVELLMKTAPMHDVGKIGVPDYILMKPDSLNSREWDLIKGHTVIGYNILSNGRTDLIRTAAEIAYTHHEKYDGSGYPRGVEGVSIPLSGRITAVCDVFDALTSIRPYKRAWRIDEAAAYIDGERGRHFDPFIAGCFLDSLQLMAKLKREYPD